ncbi:MAG: hypothetical protein WCG06_02840, partial [Candidatus Omnitrophota bacterium]
VAVIQKTPLTEKSLPARNAGPCLDCFSEAGLSGAGQCALSENITALLYTLGSKEVNVVESPVKRRTGFRWRIGVWLRKSKK